MGRLLQTAVCINLMKLLLMIFNVIFGVTGIALLAIGVWMNVSLYKFLRLSADYNQHIPLIIIITGVVIILVALLACVSTAKNQSIFLYIFGGILVVVFVIELSAGIMGYVFIRQVKIGIRQGMNASINDYGHGGIPDENVNFVQNKLACCGLTQPDDWLKTAYYNQNNRIPGSCCVNTTETCNLDMPDLHEEGCYTKVIGFLDNNLGAIAGGAVGFAFFQLIGVFLSFCLASNINKARYEQVA